MDWFDVSYVAAFMTANLCDVLSTNRALATNPAAREGNPVAQKLMDWFGPNWWVPKMMAMAALAAVMVWFDIAAALTPITLILAYVVWRNMRFL